MVTGDRCGPPRRKNQVTIEDLLRRIDFHGALSRRALLKAVTATPIAYSAIKPAQGFGVNSNRRRTLVYVGTETKSTDAAANGKGICPFEMNPATGELSLFKQAAEIGSPSCLVFHPSGQSLHTINNKPCVRCDIAGRADDFNCPILGSQSHFPNKIALQCVRTTNPFRRDRSGD
jgi:Lactonase, 7-bladed beta-propeller